MAPEQAEEPVTVQSSATGSESQHTEMSDPSVFSFVEVKKKGNLFYRKVKRGLGTKAPVIWRALMRVNFVFSIVAMMVRGCHYMLGTACVWGTLHVGYSIPAQRAVFVRGNEIRAFRTYG